MRMRTIYRAVSSRLLSGIISGLRWLPRSLALAGGEQLGRLFFRVARTEKYGSSDRDLNLSDNKGRRFIDLSLRRSLADLQHAFPDASEEERIEIVRRSYRNAGRSLVEIMRLQYLGRDELFSRIDADSFEPLERVFARGRGALILTSHLGAWELLASYMVHRLDRPFNAIVHRQRFEPYNQLLHSLRDKGAGARILYQDLGGRPILQALRDNQPVGVLGDLDMPKLKGVFVDFFGRPTYTPVGPAALARASGAGMVPIIIHWNRGGDGGGAPRHRLRVLPEVELVRTGDRHADIRENTQRWSRVIEGVVRENPEQWVWYHDRWRTRPM